MYEINILLFVIIVVILNYVLHAPMMRYLAERQRRQKAVVRKPLTPAERAAFYSELDAYSDMQDAVEETNNMNPPHM